MPRKSVTLRKLKLTFWREHMNKQRRAGACVVAFAAVFAIGAAQAAKPVVYPAKGQSQNQ